MKKRNPFISTVIAVGFIALMIGALIVGFQSYTQQPDPPQLHLDNRDNEVHEMTIEVFDSENQSIFEEVYVLEPGEERYLGISAPVGIVTCSIILDDKDAVTQNLRVDYLRRGSENLFIDIESDGSLDLSIAIE